MKMSRVGRVVKLLTILQSSQSYSVDDLAKMLGISRRTLFRDMGALRSLGVPYSHDADGGYRVEDSFFLPPINLDLREALSLCLLIHKMSGHLPMPFRSSAVLAALKIDSQMPPDIRRYCKAALQNVSINVDMHTPMDSLDKVFSQLQKAIAKRRKVQLRYRSLFERKEIRTVLSPYHLRYHNRGWYVVGKSSLHKTVRTFKLNRIKELKALKTGFVEDEKFDPAEYLGRAWSMIPDGRIYNVKLRFLPKVATNVAEVRWHSTQTVEWNDDGSATVEFRVDGLGEIIWWILGYGDQVQVLSPVVLRRRVMKTAENMIKLNAEV